MYWYLLLLLFLFANVVVSYMMYKKFYSYLDSIGLKGRDINKPPQLRKELPESFGIPLFFSISFTLMMYIVILKIFRVEGISNLDSIFYYLFGLGAISIIGFMEDLTSLSKKISIKKQGIPQKYKVLLPLIPSLPILYGVIHRDYITLPLIGTLDIGLLYPLVLVPIGIIGATNATNMLAGLNGLESLLGIVTLSTLAVFSYFNGKFSVLVFLTFFLISLLIFYLFYNRYPARAFPGDSLTYAIGFTIGSAAILGDMEVFALSIFILWFIELFLKARSKFKAESFGKVNKEGKLLNPYDKIYSLTHLFMNGKFSEKQIVWIIVSLQIAVCFVSLLIFL